MTILSLEQHKRRKSNLKMRRMQHDLGQDEFTDAEIIGGAFCDGIMCGVPGHVLHKAYFDASGAMDFEARVWVEMDIAKAKR